MESRGTRSLKLHISWIRIAKVYKSARGFDLMDFPYLLLLISAESSLNLNYMKLEFQDHNVKLGLGGAEGQICLTSYLNKTVICNFIVKSRIVQIYLYIAFQ